MKLAVSALVLSFSAFAARGDPVLRGSSDNAKLATDTGYNGLTLFLDHVKAGAVTSDDVVIGAIVDSYNKVHDKYALKSAFKEEEIAVPEAGTNGAYFDSMGRFTIGWECSSCGADEGFLPPLHVAAQASPGQHQQFVDELCQALRDSGKEAYEGITKCAVDFTYGIEQLKRLQEEAAAASDSGIVSWPWGHKSNEGPHSGLPMAAELDLHNVGEGAEQDLGEITKAFIEAYNAVHADTPYQMESFGADRVMAAREYEEEQDDGSEALSASPHDGHRVLKRYPCYTCRWVSIYGSGRFHCTMCRDERSVLPPMETLLLQYKESRFKVMEKLFCHKIGAGGNASVRNVRGCKINLVAVNGDGTALTTTHRE